LFRPIHPSFEPWLRTTLKRLAVLAVVIVVSLLVAFPQVALSAQYLPKAVRFVGDPQPISSGQKVSLATFTKTYSFQPQNFLSLVDPVQYPVVDGNEIYVGLFGLASVVAVVLFFRKGLKEHASWRSYKVFMIGASSVAGIIMLGYWTFIPALLRELPLFSQVRQLARYSIVLQFCLALMLGICIEVLSIQVPLIFKSKRRVFIGLAGALIAGGFLTLNTIYLYFVSQKTHSIDKHFVYQNAVLVLALGGCVLFRRKIQYVLLGAAILSTITMPVWFMPRISYSSATYPPNYYAKTSSVSYLEHFDGKARVYIENNALPVNIGDVYNIQTVNGYGATLYQPFYKFLNEPDLAGMSGQHLDLLNVRFLATTKVHPELKQVMYDKSRKIFIYERTQYLPRAYFADQLTACNDHSSGCTDILITKYADTDIKMNYQTAQTKTLVLSEVNYSGWEAFVDGKKVPITSYSPTQDKLFRSIVAPAGHHEVEFIYKPFGL
jgi:hypothetical protein